MRPVGTLSTGLGGACNVAQVWRVPSGWRFLVVTRAYARVRALSFPNAGVEGALSMGVYGTVVIFAESGPAMTFDRPALEQVGRLVLKAFQDEGLVLRRVDPDRVPASNTSSVMDGVITTNEGPPVEWVQFRIDGEDLAPRIAELIPVITKAEEESYFGVQGSWADRLDQVPWLSWLYWPMFVVELALEQIMLMLRVALEYLWPPRQLASDAIIALPNLTVTLLARPLPIPDMSGTSYGPSWALVEFDFEDVRANIYLHRIRDARHPIISRLQAILGSRILWVTVCG
jgi:hypothetical protein